MLTMGGLILQFLGDLVGKMKKISQLGKTGGVNVRTQCLETRIGIKLQWEFFLRSSF